MMFTSGTRREKMIIINIMVYRIIIFYKKKYTDIYENG